MSSGKKNQRGPISKACPRAVPGLLMVIATGLIAWLGCSPSASRNDAGQSPVAPGATNANPRLAAKATATTDPDYRRRAELARAVCSSCHLFPEPNLLDRVAWGMEVLPKMQRMLGFLPIDYDKMPGGQYVRQFRPFPASPIINEEQWIDICRYYLATAPPQVLPQADRTQPQVGPDYLQVVNARYRQERPVTSLIKIDSVEKRIYVGDGLTNALHVLSPDGRSLASIGLDSPPVSLTLRPEGLYITLIGNLTPSDEPNGQVLFLEKPKEGGVRKRVILDQLNRPTDIQFADLNGDGRDDIIVCSFGNYMGRFSWYENLGNYQYKEHILLDRQGAIKAAVYDFNHDGKPDLMVMMAQAREGIYLFLNKGHGEFTQTTVVEQPPAWGYSSFQLVDFNGDGFMDILTTNGDNGDYTLIPAPMKNYHGIRIYLNDGHNHFKESFFYPLNGAYKALAADFRGTGKLDIAAISFYPDYRKSPWESFVLLENQGSLKFKVYSPKESTLARWLTMDVGDIDGDGAPDVVLGAWNADADRLPEINAKPIGKDGPSILILKNQSRFQK